MQICKFCTHWCISVLFSKFFFQNDESHSVVLSGVINFTVCHEARLHSSARRCRSRTRTRSGSWRERPHKRISSGLHRCTEYTGEHRTNIHILSVCVALWLTAVFAALLQMFCECIFDFWLCILRTAVPQLLKPHNGSLFSVYKFTHCQGSKGVSEYVTY